MSEEFNVILQGPAHINLGKNGVTEGILEHIRVLMKGKKFLKIKVLKEAAQEFGMDTLIRELIRGLEIYVYDVRGHVLIISRRYYADLHQPKTYFAMRAEIISSKKEGKANKKQVAKKVSPLKSSEETIPSEDFIDYDDEDVQTKLEVMDLLIDGVEVLPESADNLEEEEDIDESSENDIELDIEPEKMPLSSKAKKPIRPSPSSRSSSSAKPTSPKKHHGKTMIHKKPAKKSALPEYQVPLPKKRSHQKLQPKSGRNSLKRDGKTDG